MEKKQTSKNKKEKKAETNTSKPSSNAAFVVGIIAIVVVAVLVFFIVRSIASQPEPITEVDIVLDNISTDDAYNYYGQPFIKKDGLWVTTIEKDGQTFTITRQYGPRELEDIDIVYNMNNFSDLIKNRRKVYVTIDPDDDGARYLGTTGASLILSLKEVYGVTARSACTHNTSVCSEKPIVTCNEENAPYAVIYLRHENETKIEYEGNCLLLQGYEKELIRAGDKVIYGWYGIME